MMRDVHSIPDYTQPCGAVATFDAAVDSGDLQSVLSAVEFDSEYCEREFLEKVESHGLQWFSREQGFGWRYEDRKRSECLVIRKALMADGALCEDTFFTERKKRKWRVTVMPQTKVWTHHPTLGPLHFEEYGWHAHRFIPALGCVAELMIEGNELGPTPQQVATAESVLSQETDLRASICERLFTFYSEHIYGTSMVMDDDGNDVTDHYVPSVDDPKNTWNLLTAPFCFRVPESQPDNGARAFALDCECRFDPEHGLGIHFQDWSITNFTGGGQ